MAMIPPVSAPERPCPGPVATHCAECRGSHLGLFNAAPAIIGARVPEPYVAIMDRCGPTETGDPQRWRKTDDVDGHSGASGVSRRRDYRRSRHSSDTTSTTPPSPSIAITMSPQLAWFTPVP